MPETWNFSNMTRTPPRYLSIPAPRNPDGAGGGGGGAVREGGKESRQKCTPSATAPQDHLVFLGLDICIFLYNVS